MASLIEQAKQIPASTIAEQWGIALKKQGGRQWACCPFHPDKNPSLCFYPDGSWYCFGCCAGGDSVALLAKLNGISMIDAAKEIILQHTSAGPVTKRPSWKQRVEALREIIKQADTYTGKYSVETAALAWDDPIFRAAIMAKQEACQELDQLYEGGRA